MKDYYTIGIVFDAINTKQYTYKVPKVTKVDIGNYIVVSAPGFKVVRVASIHSTPKDTEDYEYKFIVGLVAMLPIPVKAVTSDAQERL